MILMMIVAGMELGIIFTATSNYLKSIRYLDVLWRHKGYKIR